MNIQELADQATCDIKDEFGNWIGCEFDKEKFAALVAAHEREECAKIAKKTVCDTPIPKGIKICGTVAANIYGTVAANAIRARSKA